MENISDDGGPLTPSCARSPMGMRESRCAAKMDRIVRGAALGASGVIHGDYRGVPGAYRGSLCHPRIPHFAYKKQYKTMIFMKTQGLACGPHSSEIFSIRRRSGCWWMRRLLLFFFFARGLLFFFVFLLQNNGFQGPGDVTGATFGGLWLLLAGSVPGLRGVRG